MTEIWSDSVIWKSLFLIDTQNIFLYAYLIPYLCSYFMQILL